MRNGGYILLDELSLAEDAVLERLNSVLDRARTVLLAERGGTAVETVTAHPVRLLLPLTLQNKWLTQMKYKRMSRIFVCLPQ